MLGLLLYCLHGELMQSLTSGLDSINKGITFIHTYIYNIDIHIYNINIYNIQYIYIHALYNIYII